MIYQNQRKTKLIKDLRKKDIIPTEELDEFDKEKDLIQKSLERIQTDQIELNKVLMNNSLLVDPLVKNAIHYIVTSSEVTFQELYRTKQTVEYNFEMELNTILEANHKRKQEKEQKKENKRQRLEEKGIPTDIQTKVVPVEQLDSLTEDRCGICLFQHTMRDTVSTDCKHHFGKYCFQNWVDTCKQNQRKVQCPCCNKRSPKIHGYRERIRMIPK
jgi:hypothetical protein